MRAYLSVIVLLTFVFGAIGAVLFVKYSDFAGQDYAPPLVTIGAATARIEIRQSELEAVGTIKAARGVQLSTEESGEIIAIDFASGSDVTSGDLLITINDKVEQASRERQIANLKLARVLYDRDKRLLRQKSIPESQYDRSKADLESAIAQLAEIEARIENKRISAPFSGTTGIIKVKVGDYIEPGTAITTLQDLSELEVDFTLPARHYPKLQQGQKIKVHVGAFPDKSFQATLQAIDSSVDANTRNLLLRATLDSSKGLLPGMFARLTVNLGQPQSVVTVPDTAITYSLHGNMIYVVDQTKDGMKVTSRVVETGESIGGRTAVLSGLDSGERVVSAGQNKIIRGADIAIDPSVRF